MNVPLRLVVRAAVGAADGFLVPSADPARLAAAVVALGAVPAVFAVRGGFLLVPPAMWEGEAPAEPSSRQARREPRPPKEQVATAVRVPGAVRLRRLRGDLFVPIDADLVPALLADEQTALTRDAGLVFLPGGTALAFDPTRPLTADRWLAPPPVRRGDWEPFPLRPPSPDRLTTIERPAPPVAVIESITGGAPTDANPLDPAGPGGVPDAARPPSAGVADRVRAGVGMGVAGMLAWLGRVLRSPGLARRGADLARRAVERVPRLTEKLFGAQEAALREVLRQLQAGNVEDALRRAPIAVADPDAPARVGTDATLAPRNPRYSLRDLLGGGGTGTAWMGGADVWAELAREYRRLADEAVRRGDYRRAAYLHGVLLRDLRSAANALMQGGMYRDAAVLYRDRVKDLPLAARAFEQAGDVDEAVRIYTRVEQYLPAAELLARVGDADRAQELFGRAADQLAARGQWVAAGDLLRTRLGAVASAAHYYRSGWDGGGPEAVGCGERLLDQHLVAGDWSAARELLDAAEQRFRPPATAEAGRFFNYAVRLADDFLPPAERADLLDRTRLVFASHLRASRVPPRAAGELFGPAGRWPGPVVRDAVYAAKATPPVSARHAPPVPLADGTVTAVCVVRDTFDVLVATTTQVVCWRPDAGRVDVVCTTGSHAVAGLAADPIGECVCVLQSDADDLVLRCFGREGGRFVPYGQRKFPLAAAEPDLWYLRPETGGAAGELLVTVSGPGGRVTLRGALLQADGASGFSDTSPLTHLLAATAAGVWEWDAHFLLFDPRDGGKGRLWVPAWSPGVPDDSPLAVPPLDWLTPTPTVLEVVGVDRKGTLHWGAWDAGADPPESAAADHPDGYRAGCLVGPGLVAAATARGEVHWLRAAAGHLGRWAAPAAVGVPASPVAVVARPAANEVAVVLADGSAVRLPRP